MTTTEKIDKIVPALLKAQKKIESAIKDSKNPFFKSNYADLNSVMDACKKHLNDEGILILQPIMSDSSGDYVETSLSHDESGQTIVSKMKLLQPKNMQDYGSAISYARRYSLQSMVFIGSTDDDAEGSMDRTSKAYSAPRVVENKVKPVTETNRLQDQALQQPLTLEQQAKRPIPMLNKGGFATAKITKVENEEF